MNIGIVGSRRRNTIDDKNFVFDLVEFLFIELGKELVIVSGGCKNGADRFTEQACNKFGIKKLIHRPRLFGAKDKSDIVIRYYLRNKKIADDSDMLYALVADDRKGGTENTIKHMLEMRKSIVIVNSDFTEHNIFPNKEDRLSLPIFRK
jgi:hypothetical protein